MADANEYFRAAGERLHFLEQQAAKLQDADAEYRRDAERAAELAQRSWRELGGYLLPEVSETHLADLEGRLSYPGLVPIHDDFTQRGAEAAQRREQLAAMEEVQHTDILLAKVADEMAEIADTAAGLRVDLANFDKSPKFIALQTRGYFREGYRPGLWGRIVDWRTVSFALVELAKIDDDLDFGDPDALRQHYRRLTRDAAPIFELEQQLNARRDAIQSLRVEYDADLPASLQQEMYEALATAVRDHIESTPVELRYQLAKGDPHLTTFFKKLDALDKKSAYLRELRVTRIQKTLQELQQQTNKLSAKISKRRAKARRGRFRHVADTEIASLTNLKADKWRRRHDKLSRLRHRINEFDDYDEGSFGGAILWWDLMTRGAPGDDLYEVRTFHETWGGAIAHDHPTAELEAELRGGDDLAAAAAAALADDMARDEPALDWGVDAS